MYQNEKSEKSPGTHMKWKLTPITTRTANAERLGRRRVGCRFAHGAHPVMVAWWRRVGQINARRRKRLGQINASRRKIGSWTTRNVERASLLVLRPKLAQCVRKAVLNDQARRDTVLRFAVICGVLSEPNDSYVLWTFPTNTCN